MIVNEFGEAGIDHLLMETAVDGVVELSGGCLCCTVRGDLVDTLTGLVDRVRAGDIPPLERVVIETTGLADPTPILAALMGHPALADAYALDGVVAVVDALAGSRNLAAHQEARRQVAVADRIVVTKTDLADEAALEALRAELGSLNPGAPMLLAAAGEARPDALFGCGLYDPRTKTADVTRWLQAERQPHGHEHHDHAHDDAQHRHDAIRSFSITSRRAVSLAAVEGFLGLLLDMQGDRLLRMKGVFRVTDSPERPLVVHAARSYLHPPARLAGWPEGAKPETRLVLIGEGLDERVVRDLFSAFTEEPRSDAPDRVALLDNPLSIAGFSA